MEQHLVICVVLGLLGLCMGSFAGATVWRLRARELKLEKAEGEKVDEKEYKKLLPLTKTTLANDRSRCLHCGHTLKWYDLLPLVSWASTGGKCRYCHQEIGWFEPVIELSTASLFVASYVLWPEMLSGPAEVLQLGLWLVASVLLVILFAYDLRWFLLPNVIVFPLIGVAALSAIIQLIGAADVAALLVSMAAAAAILSGLYFVLWVTSRGQWIGLGDVKLGLALALLLGDWQLAFIALFAANLIGCLFVIPGMLAGKVSRKTRVPFGPLLIAGCVLAMLWGRDVTNWYFTLFL